MGLISVVIAGASGLVGGECLKQLTDSDSHGRIVLLNRRFLPGFEPDSRIAQQIIDFDRLESADPWLSGADQLICTLGSTIKQAGSQESFRRIDFGISYELARRAANHGIGHFLLVTAVGADPASTLFYNRVKGELEQAVRQLPFRSVSIFRPSLLLGERREHRLGEEIGKNLAGVMSFLIPAAYRPIQAATVARAIVRASWEDRPGIRIYENGEMLRML